MASLDANNNCPHSNREGIVSNTSAEDDFVEKLFYIESIDRKQTTIQTYWHAHIHDFVLRRGSCLTVQQNRPNMTKLQVTIQV